MGVSLVCQLECSLKIYKNNPRLTKRTVFLSGLFRVGPGLVNWTEFCVEIPISVERGVAECFLLGNFPDGPQIGGV